MPSSDITYFGEPVSLGDVRNFVKTLLHNRGNSTSLAPGASTKADAASFEYLTEDWGVDEKEDLPRVLEELSSAIEVTFGMDVLDQLRAYFQQLEEGFDNWLSRGMRGPGTMHRYTGPDYYKGSAKRKMARPRNELDYNFQSFAEEVKTISDWIAFISEFDNAQITQWLNTEDPEEAAAQLEEVSHALQEAQNRFDNLYTKLNQGRTGASKRRAVADLDLVAFDAIGLMPMKLNWTPFQNKGYVAQAPFSRAKRAYNSTVRAVRQALENARIRFEQLPSEGDLLEDEMASTLFKCSVGHIHVYAEMADSLSRKFDLSIFVEQEGQ